MNKKRDGSIFVQTAKWNLRLLWHNKYMRFLPACPLLSFRVWFFFVGATDQIIDACLIKIGQLAVSFNWNIDFPILVIGIGRLGYV